jgi:sarcosine oxidase gamma subunit
MRDLAEKWSAEPDWPSAKITAPGLLVREVPGLEQALVSGDLAAWTRQSGIDGPGAGAMAATQGDRYAARLARDRLLVVSNAPLAITAGWNAEGFAVTPISSGLRVFEAEGPAVEAVVARGTTFDQRSTSASAALSFAGISAILYRHHGKLRIHVDRGLAAYLWTWMETVAGHLAAASSEGEGPEQAG